MPQINEVSWFQLNFIFISLILLIYILLSYTNSISYFKNSKKINIFFFKFF